MIIILKPSGILLVNNSLIVSSFLFINSQSTILIAKISGLRYFLLAGTAMTDRTLMRRLPD
jgi:hypothetical protein